MSGNAADLSRQGKFRVAVREFGPFEEAIRQQWKFFCEASHSDLELEAVALDLGALEDALFVGDGMRRGDWDVCFISTDWIASMHAAGAALDLAPMLDREPPPDYPEGWAPSLLRLQRIVDPKDTSGHAAVLGLPYHDGPECLVYRRDLFADEKHRELFQKQHGRPLRVPETWNEFHEVARFFQSPQQNRYGAIFAAYPDGHNTVYDFLLQLWTRGGSLGEDGELRFRTPAAAEALFFLREMLGDDGAVHPDCRQYDSVRSGEAFARGEAAMMVNWFGFAAHAHTAAESRVRGLVDIAEIPRAPGCETCSLNVYWILAVAAGSPHATIAQQFLRHCATPAMDKLTTTAGAIGCRRSTWSDAQVNAAIPFYNRLDEIHRGARGIPQRADGPHIASLINTMMIETINSGRPIDEILAEADAGLAAAGDRP